MILLLFVFSFNKLNAQATDSAQTAAANKMDWWRKARFGVFTHWGVYAVPAGRSHGKIIKAFYGGDTVPSAGEWIVQDKISREEYQQFGKGTEEQHLVFTSDTSNIASCRINLRNTGYIYSKIAGSRQYVAAVINHKNRQIPTGNYANTYLQYKYTKKWCQVKYL